MRVKKRKILAASLAMSVMATSILPSIGVHASDMAAVSLVQEAAISKNNTSEGGGFIAKDTIKEVTKLMENDSFPDVLNALLESGHFYEVYAGVTPEVKEAFLQHISNEDAYIFKVCAKYAFMDTLITCKEKTDLTKADMETLSSYVDVYVSFVKRTQKKAIPADNIKGLEGESFSYLITYLDKEVVEEYEIQNFESYITYLQTITDLDVAKTLEELDSLSDVHPDKLKDAVGEFKSYMGSAFGFEDYSEEKKEKDQLKKTEPTEETNVPSDTTNQADTSSKESKSMEAVPKASTYTNVNSFSELKAAVANASGGDITNFINIQSAFAFEETITVPEHKIVYLLVDKSKNLTFTRTAGFTGKFFIVQKYGFLHLNHPDDANGTLTIKGSKDGEVLIQNYGQFGMGPGVVLTENDCPYQGSAVYNDGGRVDIAGGTISENRTQTGSAAALFNEKGQMYVNNLKVLNNSSVYAGAILNKEGAASVKNSTFLGNTSSNGGAIYNELDSQMTIENTVFSENVTSHNGGAIRNNGILEISDSTFENNQAVDNGGAIYSAYDVGSNIHLKITGSKFDSNRVTSTEYLGGGAIHALGDLDVLDCEFENNSAKLGGAVLARLTSTVNIVNSNISKNQAQHGAGLYNEYSANTNIENANLSESDMLPPLNERLKWGLLSQGT